MTDVTDKKGPKVPKTTPKNKKPAPRRPKLTGADIQLCKAGLAALAGIEEMKIVEFAKANLKDFEGGYDEVRQRYSEAGLAAPQSPLRDQAHELLAKLKGYC